MQLTKGRVSIGLVEHVLSIIILFFIFHGKTRSNPNNRNRNAMNFHKPCTCKLEEDSFTTNYMVMKVKYWFRHFISLSIYIIRLDFNTSHIPLSL